MNNVIKLSNRLKSLDALRGFDMFWIVGGDSLSHGLSNATNFRFFNWLSLQMTHSRWNGFTIYDLIFPLFMFVAGVAMPFSIGRRLEKFQGKEKQAEKKKLYLKLLKRCIILILLGLIINGDLAFKAYDQTRFASVLARIGISCFIAAIIYMNFNWKQQLAILLSILVGYFLIMTLIPVPGFGAGVLTPEGNLSGYIDRSILPGLVLRGSYDPEGILSTLPAIGTVMLGVFAGLLLRLPDNKCTPTRKASFLLAGGIALLIVGLLGNFVMPINKNIWTSSFVIFCGGWSALLLGIFYLIIDVWKFDKWSTPFIWLGMNSILIYLVSHGIIDFGSSAKYLFGGILDKIPDLWQMTFLWIGIILLEFWFLHFLYKRKLFWKI